MFLLKNTNRIKPFFVLPFILAMTGCDNMGGISCDGEDEISSIKQQIDNERMKQKQQSSLLSYFLRPLILDGSFDIKDVAEKNGTKNKKFSRVQQMLFSLQILSTVNRNVYLWNIQ